MRRLPAMFLVIALVALASCGALMACMESLSHYDILGSGMPMQALALAAVLFAAAVIIVFPAAPAVPVCLRRRDVPLPAPPGSLAEAFSSGILNTKAY